MNCKDFVKELSFVSLVVSKKPICAIQGTVLCSVKNGKMFLTCTNGETWAFSSFETTDDITFCADVFKLISVLRYMDECDIKMDGNRIVITSSTGEYMIPSYDVNDFPSVKKEEKIKMFSCESDSFIYAVNIANTATCYDQFIPSVNGVYVNTDRKEVVGTNRDVFEIVPLDIEAEKNGGVFIHKDIVTVLNHLRGELSIYDSQNKIYLTSPTRSIVAQKSVHQYVNYELILSKIVIDNTVNVSLDALKNAVSKLSFSDTIMVNLSINNDVLTVTTKNIEFGLSGKETIQIEYTGSCAMSFNIKYLQSALSTRTSPIITLEFGNNLAVIKGEDNITSIIASIV